jgi:hypothetical protein
VGGEPESAGPGIQPDAYKDKLLKYVPAETVAVFLPAYALARTQGTTAAVVTTLVALLGSLGYLRLRASPTAPPRWFFYALSGVAFLGWALGTSSLGRDVLGWSDALSSLVVLGTVFLVPLADEAFERL